MRMAGIALKNSETDNAERPTSNIQRRMIDAAANDDGRDKDAA